MPFLPLFTSIHHLAHVLTVPPTKAWLLCATPAGMDLHIQAMPVGTYWVQSPGFLKIVYSPHDWGERFSLCKILPTGALQKWTCVRHQNVKCLWTFLETWHNVLTQIIEMEVKSNVSITLNDFIFVSQHTALSCHTVVYNSLSISTVAVSLCFDNKWRPLCFKKDQWNKKLSVWRLAAKKHILTFSVKKTTNPKRSLTWMVGWMA